MPVTVSCPCGRKAEFPDAIRGMEQECAQCGRLFRLPMLGDTIASGARGSSGDAAVNRRERRAFQRLTGMTPRAGTGEAGASARRRRMVVILSIIGLLTAGAALWLLELIR